MSEALVRIERRIARLEAIEAIKQFKASCFHACDHKQPALVRECYADGASALDVGPVGTFSHRDELVQVFTKTSTPGLTANGKFLPPGSHSL